MLWQALAELARPRAENAELRGKLDQALKHRFGRRSERQSTPGCWAHARRRFVAADGGEERAQAALARIGQLYAIERELPPLLPPSDDPAAQEQRRQREEQRRQQRRQRGEPVLTELKQWLDEQRPRALPKSALGQAIGYALNHWEALTR
jgi:hypothetical protein